MHKLRVLVLSVGVAAAMTPAWSQAQPEKPITAEEEAKLARADELYRRANKLAEQRKFSEAYPLFVEAFSLKRSFDIAGNLSDMELELGKFRDAAEHAAYSLKIFPPNGKPRSKERTTEILARAKKEVCTVRLTTNVPGADVFVDGQKVGRSPLEMELYVEPGDRAFGAKAAGHRDASVARACVKGGDFALPLSLEPIAGTVPSDTASVPSPSASVPVAPPTGTPPDREKPAWPAIVLGSVAAVGLGVGIGMTVASAGERSDAEDTIDRCGRTTSCIDEADAALDQGDTLQGVGIAGFALGGASLVGMVIYLLVPGPDAAETALRVVPVIGPGAQGFSVGGRF